MHSRRLHHYLARLCKIIDVCDSGFGHGIRETVTSFKQGFTRSFIHMPSETKEHLCTDDFTKMLKKALQNSVKLVVFSFACFFIGLDIYWGWRGYSMDQGYSEVLGISSCSVLFFLWDSISIKY